MQYERGKIAARNAIFHACRLGIPNNIAIFANIEDEFRVDEGWIRAWVDTFYSSIAREFTPIQRLVRLMRRIVKR